MLETIETRLQVLGIVLPPAATPIANYVPFVISRELLFLSGQGPRSTDGRWKVGTVGANVSIEEAYEHARLAGIGMLATARLALGSLDRIKRIVKLLGFVNSVPTFKDHPKVINGCSDLIVQVFGESGCHARSVVGVTSLPEEITVEIEAIIEIF